MPRETFLPYSPPNLGAEEIDAATAVLRSDWITTGPRTKAFEAEFGAFIDAPGGNTLMLNSCTAGLHVALVALGVGPGDEVVLPTLTFAATANVVEHVGAKPVLVDVEPDTLCIDPEAVERAITPRTRVIVPVHYAGHPAEMRPLLELAERHGLEVLEDAAHALPASYEGVMVGSRDNLAAFSFYATKNMTTTEGGALSGRPDLQDRAQVIALHGMSKDAWKRFDKAGSWDYDIELPGFKYNMTDLQAAIGSEQLHKLPRFHARRRQVAAAYSAAFGGDRRLQVPTERPNVVSAWHLYVLRLRPDLTGVTRNRFIERLKELNIGTSVHFRPLHMMSYYARKYGYQPEDFPVAYDAFQRMVSLPLHPRLTDKDVSDVIEAVFTALTPERGSRLPTDPVAALAGIGSR